MNKRIESKGNSDSDAPRVYASAPVSPEILRAVEKIFDTLKTPGEDRNRLLRESGKIERGLFGDGEIHETN